MFSVIKFDSLRLQFSGAARAGSARRRTVVRNHSLVGEERERLVFQNDYAPGVWLQNITTQEPDDQQLEVAIEALKESLKLEPQPAEPALAPDVLKPAVVGVQRFSAGLLTD